MDTHSFYYVCWSIKTYLALFACIRIRYPGFSQAFQPKKGGYLLLFAALHRVFLPFIYMHNTHKPCPDTIIIIKKGKEKEEKNKYDTNTSLGNRLTILFCHRKALLCKTSFDISQNFFFFFGRLVEGDDNIAFPPLSAAAIRWPSANQYGVIIYEKQTSASRTSYLYFHICG